MADSGDRRVPECPICMEAYEAPPSARAPIILACGHCVCRGDAGNIPTGQRDGGALQLAIPRALHCAFKQPVDRGTPKERQ